MPIEAEIVLIDNTLNVELATFKSNSKTGKYLVTLPSGKNYGIAVKAEGFLFHSENFDIPKSATYQEVLKENSRSECGKGKRGKVWFWRVGRRR